MNPITKALDEIRFEIPEEILKEVFITQEMQSPHCGAIVNMETIIREKVLEARVFVDMEIQGGTETFIDLRGVRTEEVDPLTRIYYVDEELTQNRSIAQVYSLHFGIMGFTNAAAGLSYNQSALGSELRKVFDAAARTPPASTSYVNLIAHNVVMVRYLYMPYPSAFMRCRLGNDEAMSNVRPNMIPAFADLCVLAVKAHIFRKMSIPMGQAYLSGGMALDVFRDTILEWREANQMYKEALKVWKTISGVYGDPEAKRRYLQTLVGGR